MKKNLIDRLFAPEEEFGAGGGGGAVADLFDDTTTIETPDDIGAAPSQEPAQSGQPAGGQRQVAPPSQQQPGTMIPLDQIPQLMQAFQAQQQRQQPPRQLSQEEIDQRLKRVKITPEIAGMFFGEAPTEAQIKSLQMFADSIVENATTTAGYAMRALQDQIHERYAPMQQFIESTRVREFSAGLIQDFPALKGREEVVDMVMANLKQQGFVARDADHAAQVVAAYSEQLIKKFEPNFTLVVQGNPNQQQNRQQTMPTMPGLPAGAGGGPGGGSGGKPGGKPAWQDIFTKS